MKKVLSFLVVLSVLSFGSITNSVIKYLDQAGDAAPVCDGDFSASEWPETYFMGAYDTEAGTEFFGEVYYDIDTTYGGFATDFGGKLYLCQDDDNLYAAYVITVDDYVISVAADPNADWVIDQMKFNLGEPAGNIIVRNNSSLLPTERAGWPGILNTSYWCKVKQSNADPVSESNPIVYELTLSKVVFGIFSGGNTWRASFGSEDYDENDETFLGLGAKNEQGIYYDGNQWDQAYNYPEFTSGVSVAVEQGDVVVADYGFVVSPNPFNPSTVISYDLKSSGKLAIYDINGHLVKDLGTISGKSSKVWNATNVNSNKVSTGVYFARLLTEGKVINTRMILTK